MRHNMLLLAKCWGIDKIIVFVGWLKYSLIPAIGWLSWVIHSELLIVISDCGRRTAVKHIDHGSTATPFETPRAWLKHRWRFSINLHMRRHRREWGVTWLYKKFITPEAFSFWSNLMHNSWDRHSQSERRPTHHISEWHEPLGCFTQRPNVEISSSWP